MSGSTALTVTNGATLVLPAMIATAGERASRRFIEFFTANIRNSNTRAAYAQAINQFLEWCNQYGLTLDTLEPVSVAAYVEWLMARRSAPTVKQHLAAIKMLFDWLVIGQIMPMNPAASVRGPKHLVKKGKTPVLNAEQARQLIDSIPIAERDEITGIETPLLVGLRDRALIGVMVFSFARISAVTNMSVGDYWQNGKRWWLRLHEKGGKFHEVPAHHNAEAYLDAYIQAAGIGEEAKSPLFRTILGRTGALTANRMSRKDAWHMIKRRVRAAGLSSRVNCHTWRATGITAYLANDGDLENAQLIAAHESPRTTKLYDRTGDEITLDEIERIVI
jgi:site-specific recombinase XerD